MTESLTCCYARALTDLRSYFNKSRSLVACPTVRFARRLRKHSDSSFQLNRLAHELVAFWLVMFTNEICQRLPIHQALKLSSNCMIEPERVHLRQEEKVAHNSQF